MSRSPSPIDQDEAPEWRTIVGVSQDIRQTGLTDDEDRAVFWVPQTQDPVRFMYAAVRTPGDPMAMLPVLRDTVQQLDPELPLCIELAKGLPRVAVPLVV